MFIVICLVYIGVFKSYSQKTNTLEICLMNSFGNDSILLKSQSNSELLTNISTNEFSGKAKSIFFNMNTNDSTIIIKDLKKNIVDSVKYKCNYEYLYIFYHEHRFRFEYSNKLRMMQ